MKNFEENKIAKWSTFISQIGTSVRVPDVRFTTGAECGCNHKLLMPTMEFREKAVNQHPKRDSQEINKEQSTIYNY